MAKKKNVKKSGSPNSRIEGQQRLNKVLAAAGVGSRREVEDYIVDGRVEIDGEIETDLARKVDPLKAKIKVDGELLRVARPVYYALNKPPGVLSTNRDPSGRMRVIDLVPDKARVFSVGRLDKGSEGLMLLTNDGELAQRLAHPKFRVQKTYFVVVAGILTNDELKQLRKGVYLAEGVARIDGATIRRTRKGCTELEIVLSEGKNREIRRILARAGHKVVLLRRIALGALKLGQLPVGAARELSPAEVKALYAATEKRAAPKRSQGGKRKPAGSSPSTGSAADSRMQQAEEEVIIPEEMDDELLGDFHDDFDDDFIGGFSDSPRTGSVIGEDPSPKDSRKTGKKQVAKKPVGKTRGRRHTAAGTTASARGRSPGSSTRGGRSAAAPRTKKAQTAGGAKSRKPASSGATGGRGARTSTKKSAVGRRGGRPGGNAKGARRGRSK